MIGVLVSGNGTNLQALLDAGLPVSAVAANRKDAYALVRAREAGVPTATFSLDCHADRAERDLVMATWLEEHGVELVVLAGYMHLLTPPFLKRFPERVINADPDSWYAGDPVAMGQDNFAERRAAVRDPEVVRAMLEDYRAGLTVDRRQEEADRAAGRRVECPVLVLWALRDDLEELHGDPRDIWANWAVDVRGHGIDSGHHMAEEAPADVAAALAAFFGAAKSWR